MRTKEQGSGFWSNLRGAVLHFREPPAVAAIEHRANYHWLVVGCVCIGAFMGQLDASIAQLLLPRLEEVFDVRLSSVSWVAIVYLVAVAGFLPVFGRIADITGRKLVYLVGFFLFALGALICGFATNLWVLIGGRVLQGIAAAMVSANSVAIVVAAAGPGRRGKALGVQAAAQAAGLSFGPAFGGFLLDALDWRWAFWVNVPIGLAGGIAAWFILPRTDIKQAAARFDWTGALLLVPALGALMVAVNQAHAWGFRSLPVLACAALAIGLFVLFLHSQLHKGDPLVDLALFRQPGFASGNIGALLSYAMIFGLFFLMPFILIRAYEDSAFEAGLRLMIVPIALSLIAPLSGALYDRLGARILKATGMALATAALIGLHVVVDGSATSLPAVMVAFAAIGIGQGLFTSPNNSAIIAATPEHLTGEAGSLINVSRALGTSLGVALTTSILSWQIALVGGNGGRTLGIAPDKIAAAGSATLLLLAGLALIAAVLALIGGGGGLAGDRRR